LESYPEKTCDIDRLVRNKMFVTAALEGKKTQQRRDGVYAYPDEEFELEGVRFRVTGLTRETLGQMTDDGAKAEGFPSLAAYKDLILKMHQDMPWDENHKVWVHTFEKV